jgi:hypothetical protein
MQDRAPIGLYGLPSFLNHSCAGNAHRYFYGDLIMVYAVEDIRRGEVVTIEYLPAGGDINRQGRFQMSFGFQCTCPMCVEQSRNPSVREREDIWFQFQAVAQRDNTRTNLMEMERLIQQLEATYHDDKYRVNLAWALSTIADWYVTWKEHKKAVLAFRKALTYCTTSSPDGIARVVWCVKIARLAWNSVNDEFVIPAKLTMLDLIRVYTGASEKIFFEVWLPALTAWEEPDTIDLIEPLVSVPREADLRERGRHDASTGRPDFASRRHTKGPMTNRVFSLISTVKSSSAIIPQLTAKV